MADDGGLIADTAAPAEVPALRFADIIPEPYGAYALSLLIGALGSLLFVRNGWPLPWFLGALTACLVAAVANLPLQRAAPLSIPMRAVLGVAVGSAYTPALLGRLPHMMGSLALLIPFMVLIIVIGMAFYERVAGFDRPTAFYSAVPGGLTDMTAMAEDAGANVRAIILVQASRILVIVFALPLWLQWHDGLAVTRAFATRVHIWEIWPSDAIAMIAMGWCGWWIARRLGMAGAPIVGPMLASGIAHALGFTVAKVPLEVLVTAQICVGSMLGCQFKGLRLRQFTDAMIWGIANAIVLLIVTGAVAHFVAKLTGFDPVSVLLGFAPGGQTELNLLAYVLGLDVAYVALHHLMRLAIVILGAQYISRTMYISRTQTGWRKHTPGVRV